jgi:hypothetical protein
MLTYQKKRYPDAAQWSFMYFTASCMMRKQFFPIQLLLVLHMSHHLILCEDVVSFTEDDTCFVLLKHA